MAKRGGVQHFCKNNMNAVSYDHDSTCAVFLYSKVLGITVLSYNGRKSLTRDGELKTGII